MFQYRLIHIATQWNIAANCCDRTIHKCINSASFRINSNLFIIILLISYRANWKCTIYGILISLSLFEIPSRSVVSRHCVQAVIHHNLRLWNHTNTDTTAITRTEPELYNNGWATSCHMQYNCTTGKNERTIPAIQLFCPYGINWSKCHLGILSVSCVYTFQFSHSPTWPPHSRCSLRSGIYGSSRGKLYLTSILVTLSELPTAIILQVTHTVSSTGHLQNKWHGKIRWSNKNQASRLQNSLILIFLELSNLLSFSTWYRDVE